MRRTFNYLPNGEVEWCLPELKFRNKHKQVRATSYQPHLPCIHTPASSRTRLLLEDEILSSSPNPSRLQIFNTSGATAAAMPSIIPQAISALGSCYHGFLFQVSLSQCLLKWDVGFALGFFCLFSSEGFEVVKFKMYSLQPLSLRALSLAIHLCSPVVFRQCCLLSLLPSVVLPTCDCWELESPDFSVLTYQTGLSRLSWAGPSEQQEQTEINAYLSHW